MPDTFIDLFQSANTSLKLKTPMANADFFLCLLTKLFKSGKKTNSCLISTLPSIHENMKTIKLNENKKKRKETNEIN